MAKYSARAESIVADSMAEALKHAEMAKAHGDDAKKIRQHGNMSLKYLGRVDRETVGKVTVEEDKHLIGAIINLQEATSYAEMGKADAANNHIDEALNNMRQFMAK